MTLLCCFLFSILVTVLFMFFFFTDTATTEIYTLSLHDALPIFEDGSFDVVLCAQVLEHCDDPARAVTERSEEHTSELQSHSDLVCRLLLEKKKSNKCQRTPLKNINV